MSADFDSPPASASRSQRNFVLQQGLPDPPAASCGWQYAALQFQPRLVAAVLAIGVVLQSPLVFGILAAVLWLSAGIPSRNPFDSLYNRAFATRPGRVALGPAPAPRRFAQALAGAFAATIAISLLLDWRIAAVVLQVLFALAVLALALGRFCLGSFIYHLMRGRGDFARRTLPWSHDLEDRST
jgi:hypothetical protein